VSALWQCALERPLEGHPFLDTPEYDFAAGQSGEVWFWSAPDAAADGGPLVRQVTIPKGTALFLTVRDVEVSSLAEPPFFGAPEAEQRAGADYFTDHITEVSVSISGAAVEGVGAYRFDSSQFEFDAPTPWIFDTSGDTGGDDTAVGDGYYLMIKPLAEGTHTIEYSGTFHFDAGELGADPLDLPHSGTIVLNVVKQQKKSGPAGYRGDGRYVPRAVPPVATAAARGAVTPPLFGSMRIGQPRDAVDELLAGV
jgi:hypothetical protein